MLKVHVIGVGKLKEKFFAAAAEEYTKRLGRYCQVTLTEVKDEPIPENLSERDRARILKKEEERILSRLTAEEYVIALCVEGTQMSSEMLSQRIETLKNGGNSCLGFIIGGSLGLSDAVKARADLKLSFSPMTFPHQLMRVILLEQLYRAMNLSDGGKYHK